MSWSRTTPTSALCLSIEVPPSVHLFIHNVYSSLENTTFGTYITVAYGDDGRVANNSSPSSARKASTSRSWNPPYAPHVHPMSARSRAPVPSLAPHVHHVSARSRAPVPSRAPHVHHASPLSFPCTLPSPLSASARSTYGNVALRTGQLAARLLLPSGETRGALLPRLFCALAALVRLLPQPVQLLQLRLPLLLVRGELEEPDALGANLVLGVVVRHRRFAHGCGRPNARRSAP